MNVRLSELHGAASAALAALDVSDVGEIARVVADGGEADPVMSMQDAGRAIAATLVNAALLGGATPAQSVLLAGGLALASVRLDGAADEPVHLSPSAVAGHPMFGQWIAQDFAGVVAEMLKAGAAWTLLAESAPHMDEIQITDFGGALIGVHIRFVWPRNGAPITATANYGAAGASAPIRRVLAVAASAIIELGFRAPLVEGALRADEAATQGASRAAAQVAGAAIH